MQLRPSAILSRWGMPRISNYSEADRLLRAFLSVQIEDLLSGASSCVIYRLIDISIIYHRAIIAEFASKCGRWCYLWEHLQIILQF